MMMYGSFSVRRSVNATFPSGDTAPVSDSPICPERLRDVDHLALCCNASAYSRSLAVSDHEAALKSPPTTQAIRFVPQASTSMLIADRIWKFVTKSRSPFGWMIRLVNRIEKSGTALPRVLRFKMYAPFRRTCPRTPPPDGSGDALAVHAPYAGSPYSPFSQSRLFCPSQSMRNGTPPKPMSAPRKLDGRLSSFVTSSSGSRSFPKAAIRGNTERIRLTAARTARGLRSSKADVMSCSFLSQ